MIRLFALGEDHGLAGAGGRPPHAVGVLGVRVGAADHAQQQFVTRLPWHLRNFRQVGQVEEHTLAGTTTHIGGGDPDLRYF